MAIYYGWLPKGARTKPKRDKTFRPSKPKPALFIREGADTKHIPSLGDGVGNATIASAPVYQDDELAKREEAARSVKHTIAPICNKGAYQLITAEADLKTIGRKV